MGIPLAALAVRPPDQPPDQLGNATRALQLKQLMQSAPLEQQIRQTQLENAQLQQQQAKYQFGATQAVNKSYQNAIKPNANGMPEIDTDALSKSLADSGYGSEIPTILEGVTKFQKSKADLAEAQNKIKTQSLDLMGGAASAIQASKYNPQLAHTILDTLPSSPQIDALRQKIDGDPAIFKQLVDSVAAQSPKQQEFAKDVKVAQIRSDNVERQSMEDWLANNPGKGPSDYQQFKASQGVDRQELESFLSSPPKGYKPTALEFARYKASLAPQATINVQSGSLDPDTLNLVAQNYLKTGQMPAGMRSPGMSKAIINRAGQMAKDNPELGDLASNKADYEANKKSLDNLQKNLDAVTAFENTATKNLDVFLNQSKKVMDSGLPVLNTPARVIASKLGSEDQAAFNTSRTTALTEIAKVLSSANAGSGVLSDSARHEVEGLIGPDATVPQIMKAASILKQDMANRHESYQAQVSDIKSRISGKKTAATQEPSSQTTGTGMIYARDPSGKLHSAPAGTKLPAGWTQENKP